ncbi:hypothetical protein GSF22_06395 [Micromonospora echinofusca]|uniref:Uncharacterized protein n=1 Tax=Micromonospora echinofusca TaxID=47858 RepID=A0ABS3VM76_MICEH|nr:hypothetical protein [Micromonospora echinofusca]MBO4205637.1 hypothetical protein [Micromonospora echinofusca]
MNTMLRKAVLGVTGLVFAGGLAAGPALANELGVESKPAAPVVQTDTRADAKAQGW